MKKTIIMHLLLIMCDMDNYKGLVFQLCYSSDLDLQDMCGIGSSRLRFVDTMAWQTTRTSDCPSVDRYSLVLTLVVSISRPCATYSWNSSLLTKISYFLKKANPNPINIREHEWNILKLIFNLIIDINIHEIKISSN